MTPELVVRIKDLSTGEPIGSGYAIRDGLVLTAWHVVEGLSPEMLELDWFILSCIDDKKACIAEVSKIEAENNWYAYDIAILHCEFPRLVANYFKPVPFAEFIPDDENARWFSAGFPYLNDFEIKDAGGVLGVELNNPLIRLELGNSYVNSLKLPKGIESGWAGMSGAAVFCSTRKVLVGVVAHHEKWMEKELYAVSIPYLLKNNPAFKKTVELVTDTDEYLQSFLDSQVSLILDFFKGTEGSFLQSELISQLPLLEPAVTPEKLLGVALSEFEKNSTDFLEVLLQISESVLDSDASQENLESVKKIFLLFISLLVPCSLAAKEIFYSLPVKTRFSTELYVASAYGATPDYKYSDENELQGAYAIDGSVFTKEKGFTTEVFVDEAVDIVALEVYKGKKIPSASNPKSLNRKIYSRQKRSKMRNQLHRLELDCSDKEKVGGNPLTVKENCQALKGENGLPDLPITLYGESKADFEDDLFALTDELLDILQNYGYTP